MQAGRARGDPPMHATSAAMKGDSITATMFVPGGGGSPRQSE